MEDKELKELMLKKKDLIKRVCKARDLLKRSEDSESRSSVLTHHVDDSPTSSSQPLNKTLKKLNDVSGYILGIDFFNSKKTWLRDNMYLFETTVITKSLRFALDLIVDINNEKDFEVEDITCHFHDTDVSLLQECTPWIQRFTKDKNLSFLVTALMSYNEQSRIRARILGFLEAKKYVTATDNNENEGGYLVFVHSPTNTDEVLFRFTWATHFVDRSWTIEHFFRIETVNAGEEMLKASNIIIEKFCQERNLEKEELESLWSQLCEIIDTNCN